MTISRASEIEVASEKNSDFSTTLAKGLVILESFSAQCPILSNAEIAAATGLTRPTAARLTYTLHELGYLKRTDKGYRLGLQSLTLNHPVLASLTIRQIARPLMQELASDVRGTVSIGVLNGCNLVYVETARSAHTGPHLPDIGSSVAVLRTALGRALVYMLPPADRSALEKRFARETPDLWREKRSSLAANIESCAKRGFTYAYGDLFEQTFAVAAPLFHDPDFGYFALNCGVPAFRLRNDELENELGPRITRLAASICAIHQQTTRDRRIPSIPASPKHRLRKTS